MGIVDLLTTWKSASPSAFTKYTKSNNQCRGDRLVRAGGMILSSVHLLDTGYKDETFNLACGNGQMIQLKKGYDINLFLCDLTSIHAPAKNASHVKERITWVQRQTNKSRDGRLGPLMDNEM